MYHVYKYMPKINEIVWFMLIDTSARHKKIIMCGNNSCAVAIPGEGEALANYMRGIFISFNNIIYFGDICTLTAHVLYTRIYPFVSVIYIYILLYDSSIYRVKYFTDPNILTLIRQIDNSS